MDLTLTDTDLGRDIELLASLLADIVAEQEGPEMLAMVREVRDLAIARRAGDDAAGRKLVEKVASLTPDELAVLIPALSIFFDLANAAEDTHRVRVLGQREQEAGNEPRPESLREAFRTMKARGVGDEALEELLEKFCVDLVFTAHPTEAKRRTTRRLLRKLRTGLQGLHGTGLSERQLGRLKDKLRSDLTILWQIDQTRAERPKVMQEVDRGLFFVGELWRVIPDIHRELRRASVDAYGRDLAATPNFIKFGSWIGGDRDGNPFVTHDVTRQTLAKLRAAAVVRHRETAHELYRMLVISDRRADAPDALRTAIAEAYDRYPGVRAEIDHISKTELYRRWIRVIEYRLDQSSESEISERTRFAAYGSAAELEHDVRLIDDALRAHNGHRVADTYVADWLVQIRTFGLHFASLDVRQDSAVHIAVLDEVFKASGVCDNYAELDEAGKREVLLGSLDEPPKLFAASFEGMTRETLSLFRLLADEIRAYGTEPIGGMIISMTREASDVLAVLWFWNWAWKATRPEGVTNDPLPPVPIQPLFETIDDLRAGAQILTDLFRMPAYREHIELPGGTRQTVMVGYSDSCKDGGYLAAGWGLHKAQRMITEVCQTEGVDLVVFHGRGGSLGRGGGPAARAILSLPNGSVGGHLRITEQGEVLAERYDDPVIAHRHLEQVAWATLLVTTDDPAPPADVWLDSMDAMEEVSLAKYRALIEHPRFMVYFDRATPIGEIENLPIGSRPARRRERKYLTDLRAIPWTFSWTQARYFLPAWYGLGTGLKSHLDAHGPDLLRAMYADWPMFRALIDNAELALAKADMSIAARYAEMLEEGDTAAEIWDSIRAEFDVTRDAVLAINEQSELLGGVGWLQDSIKARNPYVDPLNLIQVELIKRLRKSDAEEGDEAARERDRELVRLAIQGVAAGLRTTG
ncbi:MAG: phosphoenolpyruvate carboxylase [Planctomycetota bacterium]